MNETSSITLRSLPDLLRGSSAHLRSWIHQWRASQFVQAIMVIVAGSALYGAAVGIWRDPLQAGYVAVKFPLIVLATAFGNGLLNGMLAPLFGLQISYRQSLLAILMSFMIAALILGSLSPLIFFFVWNAPPIGSESNASSVHATILLFDVVAVAIAGVAANVRLLKLLREISGDVGIARKLFFAWLAGNLFLWSQLSWILRPFIGSPDLPVEFLRSDAFHGNFYESVFYSVRHFFH